MLSPQKSLKDWRTRLTLENQAEMGVMDLFSQSWWPAVHQLPDGPAGLRAKKEERVLIRSNWDGADADAALMDLINRRKTLKMPAQIHILCRIPFLTEADVQDTDMCVVQAHDAKKGLYHDLVEPFCGVSPDPFWPSSARPMELGWPFATTDSVSQATKCPQGFGTQSKEKTEALQAPYSGTPRCGARFEKDCGVKCLLCGHTVIPALAARMARGGKW